MKAKTASPTDALPYFEFREGGVSVLELLEEPISENPLVRKTSAIKFNSTMEL